MDVNTALWIVTGAFIVLIVVTGAFIVWFIDNRRDDE
jgi:hypothetical protein